MSYGSAGELHGVLTSLLLAPSVRSDAVIDDTVSFAARHLPTHFGHLRTLALTVGSVYASADIPGGSLSPSATRRWPR